MSWTIPAGIVVFFIGYILGACMILDSWKASAKRGLFEVGGVVYRVQPVAP